MRKPLSREGLEVAVSDGLVKLLQLQTLYSIAGFINIYSTECLKGF